MTSRSGSTAQGTPPGNPAPSPWSGGRIPLAWLTLAAVIVGGLAIVALVLLNGGLGGATGSVASATPTGGPSSAAVTAPPSSDPSASPIGTTGLPVEMPAVTKPPDLEFGRSLGRLDAPIQLDVWVDFQCPACHEFAVNVEPQLVDTYIKTGKARLNFHDFAYIGAESMGAAIGARCAERQGQFWPYHDVLFANQAPENSGVLTPERTVDFAVAIGLDLDAFRACIDDETIPDAIRNETAEAYANQIPETPWLLVNGVNARPANHWGTVQAAIEAALEAPN